MCPGDNHVAYIRGVQLSEKSLDHDHHVLPPECQLATSLLGADNRNATKFTYPLQPNAVYAMLHVFIYILFHVLQIL